MRLDGDRPQYDQYNETLRAGVVLTTKVEEAFADIDFCIMLGAFPRKPGMERKDLLKMNAGIFKEQGAALNTLAKKSVKVLVVGNPANTNCLIAKTCAPNLPAESFSALTRLDHNRAKAQVALKVGVSVDKVKNTIIWGNHSGTQYPDVNHATVDGRPVRPAVNDDAWLSGEFITTVQQRGAAIINTRKLSSALSAAAAIRDHLRDWVLGTPEGEFVSMAVWSTGQGYGIPDGLIYSYPVTCKGGAYSVVAGTRPPARPLPDQPAPGHHGLVCIPLRGEAGFCRLAYRRLFPWQDGCNCRGASWRARGCQGIHRLGNVFPAELR